MVGRHEVVERYLAGFHVAGEVSDDGAQREAPCLGDEVGLHAILVELEGYLPGLGLDLLGG